MLIHLLTGFLLQTWGRLRKLPEPAGWRHAQELQEEVGDEGVVSDQKAAVSGEICQTSLTLTQGGASGHMTAPLLCFHDRNLDFCLSVFPQESAEQSVRPRLWRRRRGRVCSLQEGAAEQQRGGGPPQWQGGGSGIRQRWRSGEKEEAVLCSGASDSSFSAETPPDDPNAEEDSEQEGEPGFWKLLRGSPL